MVAPTTVGRPFVPPEKAGPQYGTIALADNDPVDLPARPTPEGLTIEATPAAAITNVSAITDGVFPGQRVTFLVANANTLRLGAGLLGNGAAQIDVLVDAPATIMWSGTAWLPAA